MDDKPSVSPKTVPREIQALVRHWDEIDKSKLIGLELDGCHECTVKDGKIVVVRVDDIKERLDAINLYGFITFDVEESLLLDADEELANKKIYGKSDIMKLFGFENQKALNFLKLLFQMEYAIKIGKSYIITAEELGRFLEENKGKEIMV